MFHIDTSDVLRFIALDPGTDTIGISLLEYSPYRKVLTVIDVHTFKASSRLQNLNPMVDLYGERTCRIQYIYHHIFQVVCNFRPHVVVTEDAFYNMRFPNPQSYRALVEVIWAANTAVINYNNYCPFITYAPREIKSNIGIVKNDPVKDDTRKIITTIPNIDWGKIDKYKLDEHSIDSISVGWGHIVQLYKDRRLLEVF